MEQKIKLSVEVDVKNAKEIVRLSKCWDMSLSGTLDFIIKHYLKFGVKNLESEKRN